MRSFLHKITKPSTKKPSTKKPSPSIENPSACPICSLDRTLGMELGKLYNNLCERCSFRKDVFEQSVAVGFLRRPNEGQKLRLSSDRTGILDTHERYLVLWTDLVSTLNQGMFGIDECYVELFALPGSPKPFPEFPEKRLLTSTASPDGLKIVQEWLDICEKSHKSCISRTPGLPVLPRRVLDVSLPQVRLVETQNEPGCYVCLSHCWGDALPACRTTSETLEANYQGIDWEAIPATFRDSIEFTKRLGMQYIWIDSMCIIQDDANDWGEQSALMANIYENAYVTLCATASSSDHGGCYLPTPPYNQTQKLSIQKMDGMKYEIYIRQRPSKYETHPPAWNDAIIGSNPRRFPLMTRAWTYQERLLSRRLVHFAAGEIMWECSELSDCECSQGKPGESSTVSSIYSRDKEDHKRFLRKPGTGMVEDYWYNIIRSYSSHNLTQPKDKLPALSGIVKQMLSARPGDVYLAGLWKKTIIADLCWSIERGGTGRRPPIWRCPSWSWAAIDGVIYGIGYEMNKASNLLKYARCLDVSITPSGPDPTGEVSSGYIVLYAPVMLAQLLEIGLNHINDGDPDCRWFLRAAGLEVCFHPDCESDFKNKSLAIGDNLLCLRVKREHTDDFCLVLKLRGLGGITKPFYERVGMLWHNTEELEKYWFSGKENMLVTIR